MLVHLNQWIHAWSRVRLATRPKPQRHEVGCAALAFLLCRAGHALRTRGSPIRTGDIAKAAASPELRAAIDKAIAEVNATWPAMKP